jgi:hypothetical protein
MFLDGDNFHPGLILFVSHSEWSPHTGVWPHDAKIGKQYFRCQLFLGFQAEVEKRKVPTTKVKEPVTHIEKPLEENVNRLQIVGEEARSVEEAIAVLRYWLTNISSAILNFVCLDLCLFINEYICNNRGPIEAVAHAKAV